MIKGHVKCSECPTVPPSTVEAETLEEVGALLGAVIMTWHAKSPHSSHPLISWIGEVDQPEPFMIGHEDYDLTVRCLLDHCARKDKELITRCPVWLVSAITVVFHSAHEGHAFELTYNGRSWKSPV